MFKQVIKTKDLSSTSMEAVELFHMQALAAGFVSVEAPHRVWWMLWGCKYRCRLEKKETFGDALR